VQLRAGSHSTAGDHFVFRVSHGSVRPIGATITSESSRASDMASPYSVVQVRPPGWDRWAPQLSNVGGKHTHGSWMRPQTDAAGWFGQAASEVPHVGEADGFRLPLRHTVHSVSRSVVRASAATLVPTGSVLRGSAGVYALRDSFVCWHTDQRCRDDYSRDPVNAAHHMPCSCECRVSSASAVVVALPAVTNVGCGMTP